MKTIKEFLVLCLLALGGCISPPETGVVPPETMRLVVDATTIQQETVIEVNGAFAGRAPAYSTTAFAFPVSLLRDGGCIAVAAHIVGGARLHSSQACLQQGDHYFTAQIQPESRVIWLNTRQ